jgi:hypothetical protein
MRFITTPCGAVRTSFGGSAASTAATSRGPSPTGSHKDRVGLWDADVGQLMERPQFGDFHELMSRVKIMHEPNEIHN